MGKNKECVLVSTDERLFYLSDDIDNFSIGQMCFNLLFLLKQDEENENKKKDFKREPIKIFVNSFGGSTCDMWALVDIMLNSKTPIYTYCTGYAMSAGFKIFLAGHKRFISKHATLLYHQLSHFCYGKYQDLKEDMKETDRTQNEIEEYIQERTKITKMRLDEVRERKLDWFIHAKESIELGIATEMYENENNTLEKRII